VEPGGMTGVQLVEGGAIAVGACREELLVG
jgi:hypothetical protein